MRGAAVDAAPLLMPLLNSAACSGNWGKWFKSTDFRYLLISILLVITISSDKAAWR